MCQVRNILFEERTSSFSLKFSQGIYVSAETQKSIQDVIRVVYCPNSPTGKCVYLSTNKASSFYDCKKCEACFHEMNIPFKDQKPTVMLFGVDGTNCFARSSSRDYEKKIHFHFQEVSQPITTKHNRTWSKKSKNHSLYGKIVSTLHWLMQLTKNSFLFSSLYTFSLQWSNMIFSVSIDGTEWSFDFGPDSFTQTVKDLVQGMTNFSQENPLEAWSLLSQKQDF